MGTEMRPPLTRKQAREVYRLCAVGWEVINMVEPGAGVEPRIEASAAAVEAVTGERIPISGLTWEDRQMLIAVGAEAEDGPASPR